MDKSASFLNILPFLFLYILLNHQEQKDVKCDNDKLYNYIPNKSKNANRNLKYIISAIPILLLLFKSNNNKSIEHAFVVTSYAIAIKTAIHFMTPCIPKQEFTNIVMICMILNLRYFNIIPENHMQTGYLASVLYSIFLISRRETTSANIIIDQSLAHFVFMYAKIFN